MLAVTSSTSAAYEVAQVWKFHAHPEVWILMIGIISAYIYMVRVIGPEAVHDGPVVTRKQTWCFVLAMALFWGASDWPVHDLAEKYLYSVHMVQHLCMSYFLAPLLLLSVPEWMARTLLGNGRVYRGVRFLCRPITAGVIFNGYVMITHIPGVVNASVSAPAPLHYSLHTVLVLTSLIAFMPICGPIPEWHLKPAGKMIYLFLESVVPTVPAAWLTFAEGTVYKRYNVPVRVWGLTIQQDQQMAGAIMKLGGSVYLWTIIGVVFFRHFIRGQAKEMKLRSDIEAPLTGYVSDDKSLTYDQVVKAFRESPAPVEQSLPAKDA
jgi:putative membrane protein